MIQIRVSPRMEPGLARVGAFSPAHTLRDLRAFLLHHLGMEDKAKGWSFLMGYPYPDPKRRLRPDHPTLDRPMGELDLAPPMGFVYQQTERVEVVVTVLRGEGQAPARPTLLASEDVFIDREAYQRRRAWQFGPEPCEAPPGLPEALVRAAVEAGQRRFTVIERRYGRAPGGVPTEAEERASLIALAEAQAPLLPLLPDADAMAQLAGHVGHGWEPPDRVAQALYKQRAAEGAPAVASLGEDLLRFGGHYDLIPLAWALGQTGARDRAEALLAASGCSAEGDCPIHEHHVDVAAARFAWGAGDPEAYIARMSAVARRTWVDDAARGAAERVFDLLSQGYDDEADALSADIQAAKRRRDKLLKRR